jgi:deazaflavin-dependent oxidoreductase (nitroreductase family)
MVRISVAVGRRDPAPSTFDTTGTKYGAFMPVPRWVARVNLHLTNRLIGPLASRLPGMGVVVHVGRKTHRQYRTPVMVFRRGDQLTIALTYGRESQWVHNVLAEGRCDLETQNRTLPLSHPRLFRDDSRKTMPRVVRLILGLLNVSDFLELTVVRNAAAQQR